MSSLGDSTQPNQQTYTHNQNGGDLVSQGSYGCVFRPALKCDSDINRRKNTVSKLMRRQQAEDEYNENKEIDSIDPTHIFHLPSPMMCNFTLDKGDNKHEKGMKSCNQIKQHKNTYKLLQYKDGGISLDKYLSKSVFGSNPREKVDTIHKFLLHIHPLLQGLDIMSKNNYLHNDIKIHNIVIDPDTYTMKYIDFGLSGYIHQLVKQDAIERRYSWAYFAYPLETFFLLKDCYKDLKVSRWAYYIFLHLDSEYNKSYTRTVDTTYLESGQSLYKPTYRREKDKYLEDVKRMKYDDFVLEMIKKVDVFSLGVVFLKIFTFMTGKKFSLDSTQQVSSYSTPVLDAFRSLIILMTHPYYKDRFSASQALDYYETNILPLVKPSKTTTTSASKAKPQPQPLKVTIPPPAPQLSDDLKTISLPRVKTSKTQPRTQGQGQGQGQPQKVCPEHKILNPKTNRCVDKYGVLGKKLLKTQKLGVGVGLSKRASQKSRKMTSKKQPQPQPQPQPQKICLQHQILNPKTNRCVDKTGVLGKKLLKQQK
jgi:serine/threonine protein kinase